MKGNNNEQFGSGYKSRVSKTASPLPIKKWFQHD
jgi:hypothetical protein